MNSFRTLPLLFSQGNYSGLTFLSPKGNGNIHILGSWQTQAGLGLVLETTHWGNFCGRPASAKFIHPRVGACGLENIR